MIDDERVHKLEDRVAKLELALANVLIATLHLRTLASDLASYWLHPDKSSKEADDILAQITEENEGFRKSIAKAEESIWGQK